jgi:hypothetical protein
LVNLLLFLRGTLPLCRFGFFRDSPVLTVIFYLGFAIFISGIFEDILDQKKGGQCGFLVLHGRLKNGAF